ncbi:hypothetical protein COO60DRAFT_1643545 [Scenedesmus sp. NREL 46B-D3]|nr:hypothetical protein COO60DRAFT_1643545 [Scenedesmus sp. NREL 46B-D3]
MHCSKVAEGLYVSGAAVAQDRAILAAHGITHVVNCVGALYPEYHKHDGVAYKTLWLQDTPQEDITCVLYDAFDFIDDARVGSAAGISAAAPVGGCSSSSSGGGRVLVHCSQGVSRSTSIAIGYMMYRSGGSYQEVYGAVRALRGVTSPNVGFMCQLINWAKRRQQPPGCARVYRIAPHCPDSPTYLVPKAVSPKPGCSHADVAALDSPGCVVVHLPHSLYVWRGSSCPGVVADAGLRAAAALVRYEGAPQPQLVQQGEEPQDFMAAFNRSSSTKSGSAQPDGTAAAGDANGTAAAGMQLAAGGEHCDASLARAEAAAVAEVAPCSPLQGASSGAETCLHATADAWLGQLDSSCALKASSGSGNSSSRSAQTCPPATAGVWLGQQDSSCALNAGSSSSSSSSNSSGSSSSSSAQICPPAAAGVWLGQQAGSCALNASSSSSSSGNSACTSTQHLLAEPLPGADGDCCAALSSCSSSAHVVTASRSSSCSSCNTALSCLTGSTSAATAFDSLVSSSSTSDELPAQLVTDAAAYNSSSSSSSSSSGLYLSSTSAAAGPPERAEMLPSDHAADTGTSSSSAASTLLRMPASRAAAACIEYAEFPAAGRRKSSQTHGPSRKGKASSRPQLIRYYAACALVNRLGE